MPRQFLYQQRFTQHQMPVMVANKSGEVIPPFACMFFDPDVDPEDWVRKPKTPFGFEIPVVKPSEDCENLQLASKLIFNGPFEIGENKIGTGVFSLPVTARVEGNPKVGESVGPVRNKWYLYRGGITHTVRATATMKSGDDEFLAGVIDKGPETVWVRYSGTITQRVSREFGSGKATCLVKNGDVWDDAMVDGEPIRVEGDNAAKASIKWGEKQFGQATLTGHGWSFSVAYC